MTPSIDGFAKLKMQVEQLQHLTVKKLQELSDRPMCEAAIECRSSIATCNVILIMIDNIQNPPPVKLGEDLESKFRDAFQIPESEHMLKPKKDE